MKYIVSIDGGSQSTKTEIFDVFGKSVCRASVPLPKPLEPEVGVSEYPDDCLWQTLIESCAKMMRDFPGRKEDLIGVGVCSIRFCRVMMRKDFSLAHPVLNWMDARVSKPYVDNIPGVEYISSANGYITARITGERKDTAANYQGMWPIDTNTWQWSEDDEAFERTGMPREKLMTLVMPGDVIGFVTKQASQALHLPQGLPVVATANDKAVEALGCGVLSHKQLLVSLGTYICSMTCGTDNNISPNHFWVNFASIPYRYLYEAHGIRRGMWLVSWFSELMENEKPVDAFKQLGTMEEYLCSLAEKIPPGSEGLMVVPQWLAQTDSLYQRGVMIGFDARHGKGHTFRAILEAIAVTTYNNSTRMLNELESAQKEIIVSGGGSNSDLFMQIFADVFGIPSVRCECNGAVSLGAAICAAVATGQYRDYETACANMVRIEKRFIPDQHAHQVYMNMNEVYKDITRYTDAVLKEAYARGITT